MHPIKGDGFMRILKRAGSGLFVGAAATFAIGLGATTALAATTLHVTVTGGGTYTAKSTKTVLTDNGINATCSGTNASTASGTISSATHTGTSPVKVGTAAKLAFNNCTSPFGPVAVKVNALPYSVKVDSVTNSSGQTDGMITGVNNTVSVGNPVVCKFTVTGSAPAVYSNSKHTLTLEPSSKLPIKPLNTATLTISGASAGCAAGGISNGDHPTFTATFTVSRAIVIKSKL
jgi:hypothetical protein